MEDSHKPKVIFKANPEISIEVRLIKDRIREMGIDEFIPYFTLSELIGRNVQTAARGSLTKARKELLREKSILFGVCIGEGIKRLSDIGVIKDGENNIKGIRRKSRRAILHLSAVQDFDALPTEQKIRHQAQLSVLGTLELMGSESSVKKIGVACQAVGAQLPLGKTFELFH